MSPLPAITDKDSRSNTARIAFPILVEYAHRRSPITYGELDREIVRRGLGGHLFPILYGGPAGIIGNACKAYGDITGTPIPPINLMLVNGTTKLPGDGADSYVRRYCRDSLGREIVPENLSREKKLAIIRQAQQDIFNFPNWDEVLAVYKLKQTPTDTNKMPNRPWQPNPDRWHRGPESEAHKALKQLIAENPAIVRLPKQRSKEEYRLWSGDELDVYFTESEVGVEVKAANALPDEVHRGLFQCVKYKAVLQARQIYNRTIPTSDCVLALGGKTPSPIAEGAKRLGIKIFDNLLL